MVTRILIKSMKETTTLLIFMSVFLFVFLLWFFNRPQQLPPDSIDLVPQESMTVHYCDNHECELGK